MLSFRLCRVLNNVQWSSTAGYSTKCRSSSSFDYAKSGCVSTGRLGWSRWTKVSNICLWKQSIRPMSIVRSRYPPLPLENQSLLECITGDFHKHPTKAAMIDSVTKTVYDFATVKKSFEKVASAWRHDEVKKGDIVCIHSTNCPEYLFAYLAALKIGAIPTPINAAYTSRELSNCFASTNADHLVTSSSLLEVAEVASKSYGKLKRTYVIGGDGHSNHVQFDNLLSQEESKYSGEVACDPHDVAVLMHSSGTTGLPKGVMLTHRNVTSGLSRTLSDYPDTFLKSDDRILAFPPLHNAFGLFTIALACLKAGATLIIVPKFETEKFLHQIQEFKITRLFILPTVGVILAKHPHAKQIDYSSVVDILCGGAPLRPETQDQIATNVGIRPRQAYGMTELTVNCMLLPRADILRKPGSVGVPVPSTEAKVIDVKTGDLLGPNKAGEIFIRNPHRMKGYYNNQRATEDCIDRDGWLRTGDIGYYDDDEYFYIVGRLKELIKYMGHQVAPAELEGVLLRMDAIADVAVVGKPDEFCGELPMAFVVKKPEAKLTENDVVEFLNGKVAREKHLRGGVVFVESIPRTPTGKILRKDLRHGVQNS